MGEILLAINCSRLNVVIAFSDLSSSDNQKDIELFPKIGLKNIIGTYSVGRAVPMEILEEDVTWGNLREE